MRARDVIASDNGALAAKVDARSLLASGNGDAGVRQLSIRGRFGRLRDSAVIANDVDGPGYDIAGADRLRLRGVRCAPSARLRYPTPWHGEEPRGVGSFGCLDE